MPQRASTKVRELQELTEIPAAVVTVRFTDRPEHTQEQRQKMATQITRVVAFGLSELKAQVKVDFEYAETPSEDRRIETWGGPGMVVLTDRANAFQWDGGRATFVIVKPREDVADAHKGHWMTKTGHRVDLVSVNGGGEIRWIVAFPATGYDHDIAAVKYFGLTKFKG